MRNSSLLRWGRDFPVISNVYLHRLDRAWDEAMGCWSGSPMTWS